MDGFPIWSIGISIRSSVYSEVGYLRVVVGERRTTRGSAIDVEAVLTGGVVGPREVYGCHYCSLNWRFDGAAGAEPPLVSTPILSIPSTLEA